MGARHAVFLYFFVSTASSRLSGLSKQTIIRFLALFLSCVKFCGSGLTDRLLSIHSIQPSLLYFLILNWTSFWEQIWRWLITRYMCFHHRVWYREQLYVHKIARGHCFHPATIPALLKRFRKSLDSYWAGQYRPNKKSACTSCPYPRLRTLGL